MKTYFQAILDSFQIIEMSNKNTRLYSTMRPNANLKQPRYLLNYSQDFGIPRVFGSFYRDWVWEGNTGGAGGGGLWHNTTARTTTQGIGIILLLVLLLRVGILLLGGIGYYY